MTELQIMPITGLYTMLKKKLEITHWKNDCGKIPERILNIHSKDDSEEEIYKDGMQLHNHNSLLKWIWDWINIIQKQVA